MPVGRPHPTVSQPFVSVVVVAYNSARTLGETLDSLAALDYPDYEVLVVDGGSTDGTVELARSRAGVRVLRADGATIGACRNRGVEASRGDYVAFTDSDCAVPPDWLTRHVARLREHEGGRIVGVGGPNRAFADDPPFAKLVEHVQGTVFGSGGSPQSRDIADVREVGSVAACNVCYDASVFDAHRYDDAVNVGEDAEFHHRLARAGYRFVYDPSNPVSHHLSASLGAVARKSRSYGYAMARVQRRHRRMVRWYSPLPSLGLLAGAGALVGALATRRVRALLAFVALFVPVALSVTATGLRELRHPVALLAPAVLVAQYACYGVGFLEGLAARDPWPVETTERR